MSRLERDCIKSWKRFLPGYHFKLWNEENFDVNQYAFTQKAYDVKKYAFVSDVARLHAVYYEGGIYFDTDMLLMAGMDSFLRHSFFTAYYRPGKFNGAVFGGEQYNQVAKVLLDHYKMIEFDEHQLYLNPDHFDKILTEENYISQIATYPPSVFYPLPFEKRGDDYKKYVSADSVAVHLWNHSWKNEYAALKYFLFFESFRLHALNMVTCKKQYWSINYVRGYYSMFLRSLKKYVYLKIYK